MADTAKMVNAAKANVKKFTADEYCGLCQIAQARRIGSIAAEKNKVLRKDYPFLEDQESILKKIGDDGLYVEYKIGSKEFKGILRLNVSYVFSVVPVEINPL